ncbi:antitoxin VbhA family protein [Rhodanobacter hydrolyticus]|uniref:antitoxin VbhA family protein n=1 Tax=Rhodanobacter hydrolyticus TaxID=2250595 RepID=UPI00384AD0EF
MGCARASISLEGFALSDDEEAHAQRFVNGEIDLQEFVHNGLPDYTFGHVAAAVQREFDAEQLTADEEPLFMELLGGYLARPNPESIAFATKMRAEGGYVGEDEYGRLVRTLPGGGVELFEEPTTQR